MMANLEHTKSIKLGEVICNIRLTVTHPAIPMLRLRAFGLLIRLAVWVGGFDGVDIVDESDSQQKDSGEQDTEDEPGCNN